MKKTTYLLIPALLIFFTGCMDNNSSNDVQDAVGELDITLIDEATGEPAANFEVFLLFEIQGASQPVPFQEFETDDNGFFSTEIYSLTQDRLTKAIIEFDVGNEARSAEKVMDLLLKFEEPYNSASLEIEIDISEE